MFTQLITVPFYGNNLYIITHNKQPYTPMKPIVEGMGLNWKAQHTKLQNTRLKPTMAEITIVAEDGEKRAMTCLPLRELPDWLMLIHPNKVRSEIREKVIMYQNECGDVLWQYWIRGTSETPSVKKGQYRPSLISRRWLVYYDTQGREQIKEVGMDACVFSYDDIPKIITDPQCHMPPGLIADIARACISRMENRTSR